MASAWACAVCGGGDAEAARKAFLDTTIFLSLLPLGMMGGMAIWVWRKAKEREEGAALAERDGR
jgi:hypothetical protein